jgi:uroporphyrin-III C-methyltransferase
VGAGPGHPDFITVRGLRALQAAQVVLYDALLEPDFQALFPPGALALAVGKRCGETGIPQAQIHALLVAHARAGHRVVRLKGGDPMTYGRGAEEGQALEAAGIPFEIIPGVSALQAASAASGIPLTHRGVAREIRVLEGHHLLGEALDWGDLASTSATLVLFMGTGPLQEVARRLLAHGAAPDKPIALVERAFREGQTTTVSTLRHAAEGHMCCRTEGPGLVYIGPAIAARVHPIHQDTPFHESASPLSRSARQARAAGGRRERRAG